MEGLFSFVFFILLIALNIFMQGAKKKAKKRQQLPQQQLPPQQNYPKKIQDISKDLPKKNDKVQNFPQINTEDISLDYIAPKLEPVIIKEDNFKEYLSKKNTLQDNSEVDFIRQTEIKAMDKEQALKISIEKQQILQAITYAQVLEKPKSLQYLKRFAIKRISHKD